MNAPQDHVLLLTPVEACPVDTNDDDCVNIDDLVRVITQYGPCPTGSFCRGDVNFDCVVNIDDLVLVITHFCEECPCDPCGNNLLSNALSPETLAAIIEAVLVSDLPEAVQVEIIDYVTTN